MAQVALGHHSFWQVYAMFDYCECMVSIINIDNGIKALTCGYQNYNIRKIMIFGGYVEVRVSLQNGIHIQVNIILNHSDTWVILPRFEGSWCGIQTRMVIITSVMKDRKLYFPSQQSLKSIRIHCEILQQIKGTVASESRETNSMFTKLCIWKLWLELFTI